VQTLKGTEDWVCFPKSDNPSTIKNKRQHETTLQPKEYYYLEPDLTADSTSNVSITNNTTTNKYNEFDDATRLHVFEPISAAAAAAAAAAAPAWSTNKTIALIATTKMVAQHPPDPPHPPLVQPQLLLPPTTSVVEYWDCTTCHRTNTADANFCPDCGAKAVLLYWDCTTCHRTNTKNSNFCPDCGCKKSIATTTMNSSAYAESSANHGTTYEQTRAEFYDNDHLETDDNTSSNHHVPSPSYHNNHNGINTITTMMMNQPSTLSDKSTNHSFHRNSNNSNNSNDSNDSNRPNTGGRDWRRFAYQKNQHLVLYVTGAAEDVTMKEIHDMFSPFGIIQEIVLQKGYVFVVYTDPSSVDYALENSLAMRINGRMLKVQRKSTQKRRGKKAHKPQTSLQKIKRMTMGERVRAREKKEEEEELNKSALPFHPKDQDSGEDELFLSSPSSPIRDGGNHQMKMNNHNHHHHNNSTPPFSPDSNWNSNSRNYRYERDDSVW